MQTIGNYKFDSNVVLGRGAFGVVYKGQHVNQPYRVAIKCLPRGRLLDVSINREIGILVKASKIQSENLVALLAYRFTARHVYLVMEYCNGGSLDDYLQCYGSLQEKYIRAFSQQLASGLKALYDLKIVHHDLKPANILFHNNSNTDYPKLSEITLKIADFGLARFCENAPKTFGVFGTHEYMAPEVAKGEGSYDVKADLWSLGIMLFECLTLSLPVTKRNIRDQVPDQISKELEDLLIQLLIQDPVSRISFEEFWMHPFLH